MGSIWRGCSLGSVLLALYGFGERLRNEGNATSMGGVYFSKRPSGLYDLVGSFGETC